MSGPVKSVKLSATLVLDARLAGVVEERSIAEQVEFWARLGRAVEPLLQGDRVFSLCRCARTRLLSECTDSVDSPQGCQRVAQYLQTQPFPHYEAAPGRSGPLVRTDADGTRTTGRFVNRKFMPAKAKAPSQCLEHGTAAGATRTTHAARHH